jgi:hypothetical protein
VGWGREELLRPPLTHIVGGGRRGARDEEDRHKCAVVMGSLSYSTLTVVGGASLMLPWNTCVRHVYLGTFFCVWEIFKHVSIDGGVESYRNRGGGGCAHHLP